MDLQRPFEEQPPMATSGLVGLLRAAEYRERVLARISAERQARQAAMNPGELARRHFALG